MRGGVIEFVNIFIIVERYDVVCTSEMICEFFKVTNRKYLDISDIFYLMDIFFRDKKYSISLSNCVENGW